MIILAETPELWRRYVEFLKGVDMNPFSDDGRQSFSQKEQQCGDTFNNNGPYFHLCTPGKYTELLCETSDDYKFFVSLTAMAAAASGVKVVAFTIMSNHVHFVLCGAKTACELFFSVFKNKLKRYYISRQRYVKLDGFDPKLIQIDSLRQMRVEIAYTHRNAYMASDRFLPYSYPWSSGSLYFNPYAYHGNAPAFNTIPFREKMIICHGRVQELPENYTARDGMILPESFCAIRFGEAFFRNAHHYYSVVSKNYEAYSEVAKALGDDVFLDDEELFAVIQIQSRKLFGEGRPSMLPQKDRLALARTMKSEYNASAGQLQRMLRLDRSIVEELFGK